MTDDVVYDHNMERYDALTNPWLPVARLNHRREIPSTLVHNDILYVIGGNRNENHNAPYYILPTIERFVAETETFTVVVQYCNHSH